MKEQIEAIIMEHFGVNEAQLRSARSDNWNTSDAKKFLWYFLCFVLGYNKHEIAKEYNTSLRNLSYAISQICDGIQIQPYFRNHYSQLVREMKDLNLL